MRSTTATKGKPCFPGLGLIDYLSTNACLGTCVEEFLCGLKEGLGAGKALENEGGTQIPNECKHLLDTYYVQSILTSQWGCKYK